MSSYDDTSTSTSEDHDHGSTLGIPQLAACLLIGYLFFRWYSGSSSSSSNSTSPNINTSRTNPTTRRLTPAEQARYEQRAELVHAMFPQVSMAAIRWELLRNGGSVEVTTEKILSEGGLREPPTPPPAPSTNTTPRRTPQPTTASSSSTATPKPAHTDLISRYNLSSRLSSLSEPSTQSPPSTPSGKSASWSANKTERQAILQKRRDEMILKARRRLEEEEERRKQREKEKERDGGSIISG